MKFQSADEAIGHHALRSAHGFHTAVRIDAGKRNGDVRIVGGKANDFLVRHARPAGEALIHGENDEGHLARAVVFRQGLGVARGTAFPKIFFGGGVRVRGFVNRLEMDMDIDGNERVNVNLPSWAHQWFSEWARSQAVASARTDRLPAQTCFGPAFTIIFDAWVNSGCKGASRRLSLKTKNCDGNVSLTNFVLEE